MPKFLVQPSPTWLDYDTAPTTVTGTLDRAISVGAQLAAELLDHQDARALRVTVHDYRTLDILHDQTYFTDSNLLND